MPVRAPLRSDEPGRMLAAGPLASPAVRRAMILTYRRPMRRALFLLAPRWLALHVLVVAAGVTMVLLGRWQWHVAHVHHGAVQNYAYAFQWWAFTAFAVFMWLRVMRDAVGRRATDTEPMPRAEPPRTEQKPVPYRRYVMPRERPQTTDPELAAYNAYLAELAERERARREY
jgi:DNA-binding transcriptional regulator of glucitol operon